MDAVKLLQLIERADALKASGKDGKDLALDLIIWLRDEHRETLPSIAEYLSSAGIPTLRGGSWRPSTVHAMLDQAGVERQQAVFPLQTIKLVAGLRLAHHSLNEIADQLTDQGIDTPKGGRWWPATVRYLIERAVEDERLPANQRKALAKAHSEPPKKKVKSEKEKGQLRVPEDLVGRIVSLRASAHPDTGKPYTMQQIADLLNKEGVATVRGGKRWYQTTVQSVLARASLSN